MEGIACVVKTLVIFNKVLTQACNAEGLFLSFKTQHKRGKLILASFYWKAWLNSNLPSV